MSHYNLYYSLKANKIILFSMRTERTEVAVNMYKMTPGSLALSD